jgi:hypothetical protein
MFPYRNEVPQGTGQQDDHELGWCHVRKPHRLRYGAE